MTALAARDSRLSRAFLRFSICYKYFRYRKVYSELLEIATREKDKGIGLGWLRNGLGAGLDGEAHRLTLPIENRMPRDTPCNNSTHLHKDAPGSLIDKACTIGRKCIAFPVCYKSNR